jgi:hypothetical protein
MLTLFAFVLVGTIGAQQPSAGAVQEDPRERLDTAIEAAIGLLEKKEYAKFISMFSPPEALAQRRDTLEEFAARFAPDGDRVLAVLKRIQKVKPTMSGGGLTATYALEPKPERGPSSLRWEKIGKYWYLAN